VFYKCVCACVLYSGVEHERVRSRNESCQISSTLHIGINDGECSGRKIFTPTPFLMQHTSDRMRERREEKKKEEKRREEKRNLSEKNGGINTEEWRKRVTLCCTQHVFSPEMPIGSVLYDLYTVIEL